MTSNQKFIILGHPRSGTTLLVNTLNSVKDIVVYGEILTMKGGKKVAHWQPELKKQRELKQKKSLWNWIRKKKNIDNNDVSNYISDSDLYKYLDEIFSENNIVGFKLLPSHIKKIPKITGYIKQRNIGIVYIYRKNRLKLLISSQTKKDKKFSKFKVNLTKLSKHIKEVEDNQKMIHNLLSQNNSIILTYEDLCKDTEVTSLNLDKVLAFIGSTYRGELPVKIRKNNPNKISERITNIEELEQFLHKNHRSLYKFLD